jgi:foldase protein PrsA
MKALRSLLLVLVLAGILVAAGCGGSEGVPENAVAVVDGEEISKTDLDQLLDRVKTSYESQKRDFPKVGTTAYQGLETQAVAYLVQRLEYEQQAGELGIEVTEKDLDAKVAEVRKQYFGGNDKKFLKQLKEQGYTEASFRDDLRSQLLSEKLYKEVTKGTSVTDAEIQKYYQDNKAQYEVPDSREVRHILVQTKAEADALYDQIKGGGDFAALAKQKSKDPGSASNGGKLTISRGQTVAPFDATAFNLPKGSLSRPVKTEFGYHLIQPISDVKAGTTTPLAKVKSQIRRQLLDEKRNEKAQKWASDLQSEYEDKVEYAEGFEPPAAATESTEPATTTG